MKNWDFELIEVKRNIFRLSQVGKVMSTLEPRIELFTSSFISLKTANLSMLLKWKQNKSDFRQKKLKLQYLSKNKAIFEVLQEKNNMKVTFNENQASRNSSELCAPYCVSSQWRIFSMYYCGIPPIKFLTHELILKLWK